MKKWALSAIIYLLVVIGAYYTYTAVAEPSEEMPNHEQHQEYSK